MSDSRKQLEAWLRTLDVRGSVIDVGGAAWPVKGRTKTWDVPVYKILDKNHTYKKAPIDFVHDINRPLPLTLGNEEFDVAFALEVIEYAWNPFQAALNLEMLLKPGGLLYCSTHFLFPNHGGGTDIMRITREGINVLFTTAGFEILKVIPRRAVEAYQPMLLEWQNHESKICKFPDEIGHFFVARKL